MSLGFFSVLTNVKEKERKGLMTVTGKLKTVASERGEFVLYLFAFPVSLFGTWITIKPIK